MRLSEHRIQSLLKESQTILTISYVAAIGIGMLFTYRKYAEFGINIFDYASVFDFLIAPFADFKILLFTVFSLIVTYLIVLLNALFQRKFPKSYAKMDFGLTRQKWYYALRPVLSVTVFVLYLFFSADKYGEISKKEILIQPSIAITFSDNQTKTGKMIGKTKEVLFLANNNTVDVIPITALVKEIRVRE